MKSISRKEELQEVEKFGRQNKTIMGKAIQQIKLDQLPLLFAIFQLTNKEEQLLTQDYMVMSPFLTIKVISQFLTTTISRKSLQCSNIQENGLKR